MAINSKTFRITCDSQTTGKITDEITGSVPRIYRAEAVQFEFAFFQNGVMIPTPNISSVTITLAKEGATLYDWVLDGASMNAAMSARQWHNGAAAQAILNITALETTELEAVTYEFFARAILDSVPSGDTAEIILMSGYLDFVDPPGEFVGGTEPSPTVNYYNTTASDARFAPISVSSRVSALEAIPTAEGYVKTGAQTLTGGQKTQVLTNIGGAPLASPTFTGTPAAPTATAGTSTTQLASTAFVTGAISTLSTATKPYLDTSAINATYGDEFTGASLNARWTLNGTGFSTANLGYQRGGGSYLRCDFGASTEQQLRVTQGTAGITTNCEIVLAMSQHFLSHSDHTSRSMSGIVLLDGSGNGLGVALHDEFGYNDFFLANITGGAFASTAARQYMQTIPTAFGMRQWLRLRKAGTSFYASFSLDGYNWSTETPSVTATNTWTTVGFGRFYLAGSNPVHEELSVDRFNII